MAVFVRWQEKEREREEELEKKKSLDPAKGPFWVQEN